MIFGTKHKPELVSPPKELIGLPLKSFELPKSSEFQRDNNTINRINLSSINLPSINLSRKRNSRNKQKKKKKQFKKQLILSHLR